MGFVILGLVIAACVGGLVYIARRNKEPGAAQRSIWPTSAVGVVGLAVLVLFVFGTAIALVT
jgi:ABC-type amino acid transport system permease subunit